YQAGLDFLLNAAEGQPPGSRPALALADHARAYLRPYANHALRRYKYDLVFEYWDRIRKINKNADIEAEFASAMALQAHGALARDEYDEAIRILRDMIAFSQSGSHGRLEMESYHPEFYLKVAERAKGLAQKNVKPEYTAKIFSLRIGLLRFKWNRRMLDGRTEQVSSSPLKIKKGDVELADMSEDSLQRTLRAMSDGRFDVTFDRMNVVDPVEVQLDDGREMGNGVTRDPSNRGDDIIDRVTGPLGEQLRQRAQAADVVFLFWWGTDPLTQHGGARAFKIDGKNLRRGNINIGVQFYHYDPGLDYMNCGGCPRPNGIGFYPHVYMHEFFHVVEARFGIKPVHGFTVPASFPAWKGRDEVDYYWWQIRENIPAKRRAAGKPDNWKDFSFTK
ncbi:MAG: hypothetical protein HY042_08800, partial [Spirochaetia bacterium]|nr:hypothetical protein [Spirochaetia bacterium]